MTALLCAAISLTTNVIIGLVMLAVSVLGIVLFICLKKNADDGANENTEKGATVIDELKEINIEETAVESPNIKEKSTESTVVLAGQEEATPVLIETEKDDDDTVATTSGEQSALEIPKGVKRTFADKMSETETENKEIYNMLKNELMSYKKVSNRITKTIDIFKFKTTYLAKISIAGKTVKLHLALDPNEYAEEKYHQKDLGEKKKYEFVPFALKVKSERSKKYAVELIAEVMEKAGLSKNDKYQTTDYIAALQAD